MEPELQISYGFCDRLLCSVACGPPISLHGPKLNLESAAGSLVCSIGRLINRFCKQMIVAGAFSFRAALGFSLSASSNQSSCFLVDRPTTSAVVSCSAVFIFLLCGLHLHSLFLRLCSCHTWKSFLQLGLQIVFHPWVRKCALAVSSSGNLSSWEET